MSEHANAGTGPSVSVILPARNAARTAGEQIVAVLAQQLDRPFELVLVDNGSTDDTPAVFAQAADGDQRVVIVSEPRAGKPRALNSGIAVAQGELIACCDADDIVEPGWLQGLVDALKGGRSYAAGWRRVGAPNTLRARELFGVTGELATQRISWKFGAPSPSGATCAFPRDLWLEVGGFDERIQIGVEEDEFFARAWVHGWTVQDAPDSVVGYRLPESTREAFRKGYRNALNGSRAAAMLARDEPRLLPIRRGTPGPLDGADPPPSPVTRRIRRLNAIAARWLSLLAQTPLRLVKRRGRAMWARTVAGELGHVVGRWKGPLSSEPRRYHVGPRSDDSRSRPEEGDR